ncbi:MULTISPECIES: gas vesicle protein GvpJ [unclassified Streptomyces]|uniref:gas vesicle protein GvpJ n=1 Tax=unclassified Streptomyces TaxID=2593676 RepID=UPI001EFF6B22|nr:MULTISPECIES: gas vesicle protein GvpJ [unclassified Streptomyces]
MDDEQDVDADEDEEPDPDVDRDREPARAGTRRRPPRHPAHPPGGAPVTGVPSPATPPAVTTEGLLTNVFAICGTGDPAALAPAPGHAGGGSVGLLDLGESLWAVTQDVPAFLFAEDALRQRLADSAELEVCVRAHHAVVAAAVAAGPVVPLPLGTLFTDAGRARTALVAKRAHFTAVLERVRGCAEWAVKVHTAAGSARGGAARSAAGAAEPAGSGRAYLSRVRERERDRHARQDAAVTSAARVHEAVSRLAVDSVRRRPHGSAVTGKNRVQVMNAAYLVADSRAAELGALIASLRDDPAHGLDVELTGPWAPYSFTGGGQGMTPGGTAVAWQGPDSGAPIGVPLVDLLDRVLATGVVISGDVVIAIAEVPLIRLSLHALLASVSERVPALWPDSGPL